ncbi:14470_t:CDS:2 [Acaulospora morrowiae]|uniref:14470_t:CDS:1 n=1 Tax=Acaulospora morrowiae TaxID=94023 RepID=A0A9N8ZCI4_9GLOM|nr:14470_t:CDS:2 [Acaulospora morrowiae]
MSETNDPTLVKKIQDYFDNPPDSEFHLMAFLQRTKVLYASGKKCVFELVVKKEECNRMNSLFGGSVATIIDILSTATLISSQDTRYRDGGVSTDLAISYVSTVGIGDTIVIECVNYRIGKSLANTYTLIKEKTTGRVVATAQHTKYCSKH